jgi:hypothetical protein
MWEPDDALVRCHRCRRPSPTESKRVVVSIVVRGPEMSRSEHSQLFCEDCAENV